MVAAHVPVGTFPVERNGFKDKGGPHRLVQRPMHAVL